MVHEALGDLAMNRRIVLHKLKDHHQDGRRGVGGVVHLPVAQFRSSRDGITGICC